MSTPAAWQDRYLHVLTHILGLDAELGPHRQLHVQTGSGLHYVIAAEPDARPHQLEIVLHVGLRSHREALGRDPGLLAEIAASITHTTSTVKVIPTEDGSCVLAVQTTLAPPGPCRRPACSLGSSRRT